MTATLIQIEKRSDWDETAEVEGRIFVKAVATLHIPFTDGGYLVHEVESPGLWDIDDESDADYLAEVVEILTGMLRHLGVETIEGSTPVSA